MRPYKPYICQTIGELNDKLGWMMIYAPTFKGRMGFLPERNLDTTFQGLNESLDNLRNKLGEKRYSEMRELSHRMRPLFESDPEETNGGSRAGREIIHEMELMLRRKRATAK